MSNNSLNKSRYFLSFLLDNTTSKEQKQFILLNASKLQLQAIIEIIYNISKNHYIKITPLTKKTITSNLRIIKKLISTPRKLTPSKYKLLQKHYKIIYHILFIVKDIIFQALDHK